MLDAGTHIVEYSTDDGVLPIVPDLPRLSLDQQRQALPKKQKAKEAEVINTHACTSNTSTLTRHLREKKQKKAPRFRSTVSRTDPYSGPVNIR